MFWEVVREVLCLRLLQTAWGTGCVPRCHSHFMAVLSLLSQCFIYLHFILIKCVADHYVGKQTIKQQTNQNKQTKILFYLTTVTNRLKNVLSVGVKKIRAGQKLKHEWFVQNWLGNSAVVFDENQNLLAWVNGSSEGDLSYGFVVGEEL